ncbi:unnamed protein product [Gongylonema pulchrum]|uniref:PPM-type phosphatase domain-containing protein n=1 Tax=Gongylonema pulchrum TaxID=637853 RepID=A0A183CVD4_9BILA|nr:unnamed protein product [Gongylonema pulchrum]
MLTFLEGGDDEILLLSRYRADVSEGSRGKYLRLIESSNVVYCLHFDAIGEMNLWLSRLLQCQLAPSCDLSDRRLLLLPDQLFSSTVNRQIVSLNLRHNSLQYRPSNQVLSPLLGWLDELNRLQALRSLNIADNSLYYFPNAATQLFNLTELILSGNRISCIPTQISELTNLTVLNVSNNWLHSLPEQLSQCAMISKLDLSFNRFDQIPDVLFTLKRLLHLEMAGNEISVSALHSLSCILAQNIDLRRNILTRAVRLTSFICGSLTELDVRDNENLSELDLSNLPTIQVSCSFRRLKSIFFFGFFLLNLTQAIIMPVPIELVVFSISFNRFTSLPEWITDLPHIEVIIAHHNLIRYLPYRLRNLNVSHNRLKSLPVANTMLDLNRLQFLRAASNQLDESVISVVVSCRLSCFCTSLYTFLVDFSCLSRLLALQEVNLSCNRLTSIASAFGQLPNLQVLRVHSNAITTMPDLSQSALLYSLDISNNEFGYLDTDLCMARTLKHLDLTCNYKLQVDTSNIRPKKEGRAVSVVDVASECNYASFHFGFSETAGQRNKLCIRQIRPCSRAPAIFGIVDGGKNDQIAALTVEKLTAFLQKQVNQNFFYFF